MYFWLFVLVTGSLRPIGLDYIFWLESNQEWLLLQAEQRGCSSAGRAPDLHSGGRRFDPDQLHQLLPWLFSLCVIFATLANDRRQRDRRGMEAARRTWACSSGG